jgi:hypothetical protein
VFHLNNTCRLYNFQISTQKNKTVAFKGKCPIIFNVVIDETVGLLEYTSYFNYLGSNIFKTLTILFGRYIDSKICVVGLNLQGHLIENQG